MVIIGKDIMDALILVCYSVPTEAGEISSLGRELLLEVVGVSFPGCSLCSILVEKQYISITHKIMQQFSTTFFFFHIFTKEDPNCY